MTNRAQFWVHTSDTYELWGYTVLGPQPKDTDDSWEPLPWGPRPFDICDLRRSLSLFLTQKTQMTREVPKPHETVTP